MTRFPVVLVGTEFWGGLRDWVESSLLKHNLISPQDMDLLYMTDDPDEVISVIQRSHRHLEDTFERDRPGPSS